MTEDNVGDISIKGRTIVTSGRRRAPGSVRATPAYDIAREAARATDEMRAKLGLDSDACLPRSENMKPATL